MFSGAHHLVPEQIQINKYSNIIVQHGLVNEFKIKYTYCY